MSMLLLDKHLFFYASACKSDDSFRLVFELPLLYFFIENSVVFFLKSL